MPELAPLFHIPPGSLLHTKLLELRAELQADEEAVFRHDQRRRYAADLGNRLLHEANLGGIIDFLVQGCPHGCDAKTNCAWTKRVRALGLPASPDETHRREYVP